MTAWTLIRRGLRFYWRTHLALVLGAAAGTAVLTGALAVGDSVRGSLRQRALERLGRTALALAPGERFFRAQLADDLARSLPAEAAPVLGVRGSAWLPNRPEAVNRLNVLGVDGRFWSLGAGQDLLAASGPPEGPSRPDAIAVNESLAARLGVRAGDELLLRLEKPGPLPGEAPLSLPSGQGVVVRATVEAVVAGSRLGDFGLQANQAAPLNVFLPLSLLAGRLDLAGRANILLLADGPGLTVDSARSALRRDWQLADAGLELRQLSAGEAELRSRRIFLEAAVVEAARKARPPAVGLLTYFVNSIRARERSTPYSMVSAVGLLGADAPAALAGGGAPGAAALVPPGMGDDQIVVNSWLADDLEVSPGDSLELTYFVLAGGGRLIEHSRSFRVHSVIPLSGPAADGQLMPDFPGLAEVQDCRDWKPGVAIDLDRIRKKDQDYWNRWRGAPKAFVTLRAGQEMWANRFGGLTAVRWAAGPGDHAAPSAIAQGLRRELDPSSVGLFFQPVRRRALAAAEGSTDFGQLFLGFSFFLILSALLLVGLLFVFTVEQRGEQTGLLLAVGFSPAAVRRLFLAEGGLLAVAGTVVGLGAGMLYTRGVLYGLSTLWRGAAPGAEIGFHARWATLAGGAGAALAGEVLAIALALRGQVRRPARQLLTGTDGDWNLSGGPARAGWKAPAIALVLALLAGGVVAWAGAGRDQSAAAAFFAAGAFLLASGLTWVHVLLSRAGAGSPGGRLTLAGLAGRNACRRRGRSLAVVAVLACACFLVVAVGANRLPAAADPFRRSSGTGGFALMGETSLPIVGEPGDPARNGHSQEGPSGSARPGTVSLPASMPAGVRVLPLRLREGDQANCLNLNRAQAPRLLGVDAEQLQSRGAFTFVKTSQKPPPGGPWLLLDQPQPDGATPAVGDEATVTWALGKSVGDTLPYTDEAGRVFQVRLVGVIANSILQGGLLISEGEFIRRFPSQSGYRLLLVDCLPGEVARVSSLLTGGMRPVGLDLAPAAETLERFAAVENTYLAVFGLLGGLGMVLGSVGLGLVVLRNVLERRSELAILQAVGFTRRRLVRLVFAEHGLLLAAGLACGTAAGLLALVPTLRAGGRDLPYISLPATLLAVLASGVLWTFLAARLALRGSLLDALRNE